MIPLVRLAVAAALSLQAANTPKPPAAPADDEIIGVQPGAPKPGPQTAGGDDEIVGVQPGTPKPGARPTTSGQSTTGGDGVIAVQPTTPPTSEKTTTELRAQLQTLTDLTVQSAIDPRGFDQKMSSSRDAYDHVFGRDSFNHLKTFETSCIEKCKDQSVWMNAITFFQKAGDLASLEDDARRGTIPRDSDEYTRRDAAIKSDLKTTIRAVIPANTDGSPVPKDVVDNFNLASEPVMKIVLTPPERQDQAQQVADQTGASSSYSGLGDALLQNGNAAAAKGAYTQAIGRDPQNSDAYGGRAQAEFNLGDFPSAARDAASALDINPQDDNARSTLLLSERRIPQGSWPELHNDLAKSAAGAGLALNLAAPDDGAVGAVGAVPKEGSDSAHWRAPGMAPSSSEAGRKSAAFTADARKALQVGDAKASLDAAQKAIAADPRNPEAYSLQAVAYRRLHDYPQMLAAAEAGLALVPGNRVLLNQKAFALNHLRDYKRALQAASRVLELSPRDAVAHFNKANALAGLGDRQGALAELKAAASLDKKFEPALNAAIQMPQDSDLLFLFGDDGKKAGAPSLFDKALAQTEDPGWGAFALEAGVGALLVLALVFAYRRLSAPISNNS